MSAIAISYIKGDIFAFSPSPSILAHACNCYGVWGSGVAAGFKKYYPSAYKVYSDYCMDFVEDNDTDSLVGTCLLIRTSKLDKGNRMKYEDYKIVNQNPKVDYIACLFTSEGYGRDKDSQQTIIKNTKHSYTQLKQLIVDPKDNSLWNNFDIKDSNDASKLIIHMPKINAGIFDVPWEQSKDAIEQVGQPAKVYVIE